jgi:hypothetical protein
MANQSAQCGRTTPMADSDTQINIFMQCKIKLNANGWQYINNRFLFLTNKL